MEESGTPLRISSARPYFPSSSIEWILGEMRKALESGVLTRGAKVRELESSFSEYIGVRHAIAVANGTAALEIVLRFFKVEGSEILVPTNTFLATGNAVIFAGGIPVFTDIDPHTLCITLDDIKAKISPRTRGVIVVHIAGLICPETSEIRRYCLERGLFLIEDAAHAHGATLRGRRAGSFGDAGAFSFFPTKVMTTGEGGIITTNNEELANFAKWFRNHGVVEGRAVHDHLGHNWRMDELSAILGLSQMQDLEMFLCARQKIALRYDRGLRGVGHVILPVTPADAKHCYYKYPIIMESRYLREELSTALRTHYGIETGSAYYPPCHLQPIVRQLLGYSEGMLPKSEDVLPRVLCVPVHVGLKVSDVDYVISAIKDELKRLGPR